MSKKVYGDQPHPDIASYYNNIGALYDSKGETEKANEFYQKAKLSRKGLKR